MAQSNGSPLQLNRFNRCMEWVQSIEEPPASEIGMIKNVKFTQKEIICEWKGCEFTTSDEDFFGNHMTDHTKQLEVALSQGLPAEVQCQWLQCGWTGTDMASLRRGIGAHTWSQLLAARGQALVSTLATPPCSRSPPSTEEITSLHLLPPFVCHWHDCDDTFLNPQTFYMHVRCHAMGVIGRNKSLRQTMLKCCWAGCGQRARLEHVRTHSGERITACPHCHSTFASKKKLEDHLSRQNAESARYTCDICDGIYGSDRLLQIHRKRHYMSRCECNVCGEYFSSRSALARHHRYRHIPDRPYACQWCSHSAVSSWDLSKHIRRNHAPEDEVVTKKEKVEGEDSSSDKIIEVIKVIKRLYACHLCRSRVAGAATLTRHFRTLHNMQNQIFRYEICSDGLYRMVECHESLSIKSLLDDEQENRSTRKGEYQMLLTSPATEDTPAKFVVYPKDNSNSSPTPEDESLHIYIEELDDQGNVINYSVVDAKTTCTLLNSSDL